MYVLSPGTASAARTTNTTIVTINSSSVNPDEAFAGLYERAGIALSP